MGVSAFSVIIIVTLDGFGDLGTFLVGLTFFIGNCLGSGLGTIIIINIRRYVRMISFW